MKIQMLNHEMKYQKEIKYIYNKAIPSKIPYSVFENLVLNSPCNELPEFYILKNEGECIGYLLLLANTTDTIPKPFGSLACHNGDKLSQENHRCLLQFIIDRAKEKKYFKLERIAQYELSSLT